MRYYKMHLTCRKFQSTLPVRGATLRRNISYENLTNFNPRSPCGERHQLVQIYVGFHQNFNPRSPCGERLVYRQATTRPNHFNPRSPCGERQQEAPREGKSPPDFNPRSPCGERRLIAFISSPVLKFQSTLPVRGATELCRFGERCSYISIHAPRAGSDRAVPLWRAVQLHFNPRSPCGERHAHK